MFIQKTDSLWWANDDNPVAVRRLERYARKQLRPVRARLFWNAVAGLAISVMASTLAHWGLWQWRTLVAAVVLDLFLTFIFDPLGASIRHKRVEDLKAQGYILQLPALFKDAIQYLLQRPRYTDHDFDFMLRHCRDEILRLVEIETRHGNDPLYMMTGGLRSHEASQLISSITHQMEDNYPPVGKEGHFRFPK